VTAVSDLFASRELLWNLTLRELRGKYKRSALGWTWSLVNPLVTMVIFTVVFGTFLSARGPYTVGHDGLNVFALWLMCGLLPWTYLSNTLNGSAVALVGNGNLIKKVYFPREALVGAVAGANLVNLLIEFGVLVLALAVFGNDTLPWLPLVVLVTALLLVFVTGIALALSVLNVYFRDVQHFLAIGLQLWFYASPIVYPQQLVQAHLSPGWYAVYRANPFARFAEAYRDLLYDLRWPSPTTWAFLVCYSAAAVSLGWWIFGRLQGRLAEEL
jgi:ABC-2 type transport system permease protein